VLELNASDDRKLDVVREQIKNFASTRTIFSSQFKLVILDEADAMTQAAQMALRRVIEKFTTNTRFCLICNYVNRIIPALQSRCTRFRFQPLPEQVVRERLQQIAQLEGVTVLEAGIDGILHLSKGDMRKCLNIMQSASMFSSSIDESAVYSTVGAPPPSVVSATIHVLLNQPLNEAVDHIRALMTTSGVAVQDLITELHGFVVRMKLPPKVTLYLLVGGLTDPAARPQVTLPLLFCSTNSARWRFEPVVLEATVFRFLTGIYFLAHSGCSSLIFSQAAALAGMFQVARHMIPQPS
jgi:replication factor C subunit 3/5